MPKERDWIDYANFGSNLFRNLQLSGVQDKLGTMASATASEQARAEAENSYREYLFQAQNHLKKLRTFQDDEKAAALALATFMLATLERNNLTTASFRSFEDKERVQSVLDGYMAVVEQCSTALSTDERTEALLCARYMENPAVTASAPPELTQQLQTAQQELSEMTAAENRGTLASSKFTKTFVRSTVCMVVGFIFWVVSFLEKLSDIDHESVSIVEGISIFLSVVGGMILATTYVRWFIHKNAQETRKQSAGAVEATRLKPAKEEEVKAIQQKINDELRKEQIKLETERDALMAKVLKIDKTSRILSGHQTSFDVGHIMMADEKIRDTVLALMALGYKPDHAEEAARASLAFLGPDADVEDLVRNCVRNNS